MVERVTMAVAGLMLFLADRRFDLAGLGLTAVVLILHVIRPVARHKTSDR